MGDDECFGDWCGPGSLPVGEDECRGYWCGSPGLSPVGEDERETTKIK